MFVVEVGAASRRCIFVRDLIGAGAAASASRSDHAWLWFTVLFANFAEAMAEGRGKAQADTLRKTRTETVGEAAAQPTASTARRVPAHELRPGDIVLVEAGEIIPATARSSKASRRSTSRRSPANPRR